MALLLELNSDVRWNKREVEEVQVVEEGVERCSGGWWKTLRRRRRKRRRRKARCYEVRVKKPGLRGGLVGKGGMERKGEERCVGNG